MGPRRGAAAKPRCPCVTCGSSSTTARVRARWRCAAFPWTCRPARPLRCWAATARARARCCAPQPVCSPPTGGPCGRKARSRCCCRLPPTTCCTNASPTSCRPTPPPTALHELGLDELGERDPHDLSGGARQRLALGIVLAGRGIGGGDPPAVIALDEPTRGMDQARKRDLAGRLGRLAAAGAAIVVATHDVEFAARTARRCVLLGRGRVVADGPTREILSGGRYFTTEVARVLGPDAGAGAGGGGRGRARARPQPAAPPGHCRERMSWQAGSALVVTLAALAGMLWYERRRPSTKLIALVAALAALAVAARILFAAVPNVQGTTDVALLAGYVLGPAPGFMVGALAALASNLFLGQGPWTPWQMVGWGAAGLGGALLASLAGSAPGPLAAGDRLRTCRPRLRRVDGPVHAHELRGADLGRRVRRDRRSLAPVQHRARARQRAPVPGLRPVVRTRAGALQPPACTCGGARSPRRAHAAPRRSSPCSPCRLRWSGPRPPPRRRAPSATVFATSSARRTSDGGFGGAPGQASSQLITGWTVLGLEAAGRHPLDVRRGGRTPIDFVRAGVGRALGDGRAGTHDHGGVRRRPGSPPLRRA